MGSLSSPVLAISRVHFNKVDAATGISNIQRMTVTHRGGAFFILTTSGGVYTNSSVGRSIHLGGSIEMEIKALMGLGLVNRAEAKAHKDFANACSAWRGLCHDNTRAKTILGRLSLPTTDLDLVASRMEAVEKEFENKINEARRACEPLNAKRKAESKKSK